MEIIELNKFSHLHDGEKIFFCKTDFIEEDFETISKLENQIILITGNSDYPINEDRVRNLPKNVKKWYGQNILVNHEKIEPIPMGIENRYESVRKGHGVSYYDRVTIKENLLSHKIKQKPSKKIYSNFQINTNFQHRYPIMELCKNLNFIDWEEPNLPLDVFFDKILDYEMIVCPAGNGVDTHRIWEVLYSERVPITIKVGNFKIYELYEKLPIIILENINQLSNLELIEEQFEIAKSKLHNIELIDFNYWVKKINKEI